MAGTEQRPDDVEGHGLRFPDDAEGHAYKLMQDTEAVDEDQAGDDTEGQMRL